MPELPEVETMVRGLRPALQGRTTLRRLTVHDPFLLQWMHGGGDRAPEGGVRSSKGSRGAASGS